MTQTPDISQEAMERLIAEVEAERDALKAQPKGITIDMANAPQLPPEAFDPIKDMMIEGLISGGNEWRSRAEADEAHNKELETKLADTMAERDKYENGWLEAEGKLSDAEARLSEWQVSQHYTYIGKDGKPVLARDLEARNEELEAALAATVQREADTTARYDAKLAEVEASLLSATMDGYDMAKHEYRDRIEELEAKLAKALEHIEWFISEDETNRGDEPMPNRGGQTWDEINSYWIKHLDSAIGFVAELKGEKDE